MDERASKANGAPTLTEALHERLRHDIILGVLPPAAKLKLEKLSKAYGVSVNTLRETLSRLAADGLVVAEGQKGFAVLPVSIEDLREITEMRQLLECHALRQSIAAADLDWEARVVGAHHKLSKFEELVEAAPETYGEPWERANQEFHEALVSNCRSRWLRLYLRAMYDHSRRYRMLSLKTKPFPRSQSAEEHRRILDAAIKRDGETASGLLADHILKAARSAAPETTSSLGQVALGQSGGGA
jgi:GntR family carbon starvation induced transcriptional regulator